MSAWLDSKEVWAGSDAGGSVAPAGVLVGRLPSGCDASEESEDGDAPWEKSEGLARRGPVGLEAL